MTFFSNTLQLFEIVSFTLYLVFLAFHECLKNLGTKKESGKVCVRRIVWKKKMVPGISRRQDFLIIGGQWMDVDVLDNPCWHLYCLEKDRAFFVLLPRHISYYSISHFPFMYVPVNEEALAVAEVQKEEFLQLSNMFASRPHPKTVLFTNTARCGSTLLGQMLDRPGRSICFGEPHCLCNLSIALGDQVINDQEATDLTEAAVKCLRAYVTLDQVCIIKTTSAEAVLVPFTKGISNLKHIFMFRKKGLPSVERMLQAALLYASSYSVYLENQEFYGHPIIWYHELLENTSNTLSELFTLIPPICEEEKLALKEYATILNVPEDIFDLIWGTGIAALLANNCAAFCHRYAVNTTDRPFLRLWFSRNPRFFGTILIFGTLIGFVTYATVYMLPYAIQDDILDATTDKLLNRSYREICYVGGLVRLGRKKQPGKVYVSRIIVKINMRSSISRRQDFLTVGGQWMNLDVLDNPCWYLYCVEKDRVFFVLIPRPIFYYSISRFPFMNDNIYDEALSVAEVQKEEFLQLSKMFSKRHQPKTVLFTNTARCGSTLLGKMLDRPGHSICFGEPHSLINLSMANESKKMTEGEISQLLEATVTCLRAHVPGDQVCVLKTSSDEAPLVPFTKGFSNLKNIFMFRKKGLISVERMLQNVEFSANIFLTLDKLSPTICRFITDVYLGGSWANKLKPKNLRFHCAIIYASPYADYLKNKDFYCHPIIWYHDLLENPAKTLSDLFSAIDIPINCVEEALGCMKEDSQKNSFLSWEKMKHIGIPPITDEDRFSLKEYALAMGIPEDTFDF